MAPDHQKETTRMPHTIARRCLLVAAPLAALALSTAPAAATTTVGAATLNGTAVGSPALVITGAMNGAVDVVGQASFVIQNDPCSLAASGSTISGSCTGAPAMQISGTYTKAGAELVATGTATINGQFTANIALACTINAPFAACTVQFQG